MKTETKKQLIELAKRYNVLALPDKKLKLKDVLK